MRVYMTVLGESELEIMSEEVEFISEENRPVYVFSEDSEIANLANIKHGVLNMGDAVACCIGATQMESLIFAENNIQIEISKLDEKRVVLNGILESVRDEMRDQLPY